MPHFTVVPVKDQAQARYDSLEGINWVDYRDTGQDQDTGSSDGKFDTLTQKAQWHVGEVRASVGLLGVCETEKRCVVKLLFGGTNSSWTRCFVWRAAGALPWKF